MRLKIILCGILGIFLVAPYGTAAIYQWKDETGNTHITDNYDKIPAKYRSQLKVTSESRKDSSVKRTVVKFRREGSSILVNATLNYTQPVIFHLDTGATNTMILAEDATALGLDWKNAPKTESRIADGSKVEFPMVMINSIRVGEAEVRNLTVMVGKVRLLGLNFLKKFKVTVDSKSENLILDAPESVMRVESESVREDKRKAIKDYEIKIEKAELQIKAIRKNIELVKLQLDEYQEKNFTVREKLREAVQNNASQSRINRLESINSQYDLAIENGQLNLETFNKDIDILKNNIEFFEQQIRQLQ